MALTPRAALLNVLHPAVCRARGPVTDKVSCRGAAAHIDNDALVILILEMGNNCCWVVGVLCLVATSCSASSSPAPAQTPASKQAAPKPAEPKQAAAQQENAEAPAAEAASEKDSESAPNRAARSGEMASPSECEQKEKLCLPSRAFVKRMCGGKHPDAAILLFEKSARWTRGYIRMKEVDAINTLGGPSGDTKLVFSEEVVILSYRSGGSSGMSVSGAGGYEVLRWDGTCATLAEHELVTWMPALPQNAPINWKYLDESIQEALLRNTKIRAARDEHRRECRGASVGGLSAACERAVKKLNDSIVTAVRAGIELPAAERFL